MTLPWTHPDATPLDDIRAAMTAMQDQIEYQPTTLRISSRMFTRILRSQMTKRRFRRWRGKGKAVLRVSVRRVGAME